MSQHNDDTSKKDLTDPVKNPKKHLYSRENKGNFKKTTTNEEYYKNWEDDRI